MHIRATVAIGLVVAAQTLAGCGSIKRSPQATLDMPFEAPSVWLDLPASPFEVSHKGPRAVLADRTGMNISSVSVGCVQESRGLVTVVSPMWTADLSHGAWTTEYPLTGVLEDISRLYRNPEAFARLLQPRRPCPDGSSPSITDAKSRDGFKWSAERTGWPLGPPHDTRNTWKVTAKATPTFEYVSSGGCGDADVYASNTTDTEMLWVRLDLNRKRLPTAKLPLVVKVSSGATAHNVELHVYGTDRHDWFCSDVAHWASEQPTIWLLRRGTLTAWAEPKTKDFGDYPVTVRIDDAEFVGPGGRLLRPGRPLEIKALAGGMVGG